MQIHILEAYIYFVIVPRGSLLTRKKISIFPVLKISHQKNQDFSSGT